MRVFDASVHGRAPRSAKPESSFTKNIMPHEKSALANQIFYMHSTPKHKLPDRLCSETGVKEYLHFHCSDQAMFHRVMFDHPTHAPVACQNASGETWGEPSDQHTKII